MTPNLETPFVLTTAEQASALWKKIEAHLQARLDRLRERNDQMMPEPDRCNHLGKIAEVKSLLALGAPVPSEFTFPSRPGFPSTAK